MTQFAYPLAFLLLLVPFALWAFLPPIKGLHGDALRLPFLKDIEKISIKSGSIWSMSSNSSYKLSPAWWMMMGVWALLVTAAARPQWLGEPVRLENNSRDILLVLDISNSMLERDFAISGRRINRLTAVKNVVDQFINKRTDDRMGLILFGTRAYLQAPLTYDKQSVKEILWSMDAGMAGDSTAIGDALGLALKTLKDSKDLDNKVIILLTDGENNDGSLSLPQVTKLAKDENIKIYTIGVGSPHSMMGSFFGIRLGAQSNIDEKSLKELAQSTKGNYFSAADTGSLQKIYNTIDRLEPQSNDDKYVQETKELYYLPLLAALALGSLLVLGIRRLR